MTGHAAPGAVPDAGVVPEDVLRTPRLRLEPLRVDDADEMADVLGDPALYEITGGSPPTPRELRDRYETQARGGSPDGEEVWRTWIVRETEGGAAVGFVQATITDEGAEADLAWVVGVPWQGRGYATEAARAMVAWLRAAGTRTVTAHIHPDNAPSAAVARSLGLDPTNRIEDGERVWQAPAPPRAGRAAARERQGTGGLSVVVGVALVGFGLFEIAMVERGALPGSPDQLLRDVLLAVAGVVLVIAGSRAAGRWLRSRRH